MTGFASGYGGPHLRILLFSSSRHVTGASIVRVAAHLPQPAIGMDGVVFLIVDLSEVDKGH